jgi:thiol-disulfide isomerase/thioredoxin
MSFDEVRTQDQAKRLEEALEKKDGDALLLVFADWCGHCTTYKPMWKKMAQVADGVLTAAVHFDQVDNVPALKDAKLDGYPTVIRVKEDGSVETVPSADMRDEEKMKTMMQKTPRKKQQTGMIVGERQEGGSLRKRKRSLRAGNRLRSLRPPVSRKQRRTRRKNTRRARRF